MFISVPKHRNTNSSKLDLLHKTTTIAKNNNLFIFTKTAGRLGNQLFRLFSTLGIAFHNNRQAVFEEDMLDMKRIFPRLQINVIKEKPNWTLINNNRFWEFKEKMFHLPKTNLTFNGGHQYFRYFENRSSWLQREVWSFFNPVMSSKAKNFIHNAKDDFNNRIKAEDAIPTSVCVHVRRGDKSVISAQRTYELPSVEAILNAMNYFESKLRHVVFIVSSDTREWCREHLVKENVYISSFTSVEEDFVLLSSCDHMLMTAGTFGWWAGWLTAMRGGTVLYYDQPYVEESWACRNMDKRNIFPHNWIAYNSTNIMDK